MTSKGHSRSNVVSREAFFWDCVEHEAREAEKKRVFYFKVDVIPTEIGALYWRDSDEALWRPLWEEYLTSKYKALTLLNQRPRARASSVAKHVGIDVRWVKIAERWQRMAPRERLVFQLRAEQIGDVQTVKDTWYDEIESINAWIASCLNAVDGAGPSLEDGLEDGVIDALRRQVVGEDGKHSDTVGAPALDLMEALREECSRTLEDVAARDLFVVEPGSPVPIDDSGLAFTAATLSLAMQGEQRLEKYVEVLIATVKAHFSASVVDFLVVRRRHADDELELFATTALVKEEDRYELEREASYSRPTGITGSVLVARGHHTMFHVGTNDLENDPRQSPEHRSAYERSYGKLENFWVFPVHMNGALLGALRVVNRVGGDGEVIPWPYLVRRRLVGLMTLVANLWQVCGLTLDDHAADGVAGEHVAAAIEAASGRQTTALEGLVSRARLRLVSENLASVLQALANLAEVRVEERPLDVAIVILGEDRIANPEDLLPSMAFESLQSPPQLSELIGGETTLVISSDGRIMGRYLIPSTAETRPVDFSRQFDVELVLSIGNVADRVIHIWREGEHLADYVFLPRIGTWAIRDFTAGAEELSRHQTALRAHSVEDVLRRAVRLSYAHGATLVLRSNTANPLSDSGESHLASLTSLPEKEFNDLAGLDGAVVMSDAGTINSIKVTLPTKMPDAIPAPMRRKLLKTHDKLKRSLRGTRHESALFASTHYPDAVVFCASENRTVCAFIEGKDILWDF